MDFVEYEKKIYGKHFSVQCTIENLLVKIMEKNSSKIMRC